MSNHVHRIIVFNHTKCRNFGEKRDDADAKDGGMCGCKDAINRVYTTKLRMNIGHLPC